MSCISEARVICACRQIPRQKAALAQLLDLHFPNSPAGCLVMCCAPVHPLVLLSAIKLWGFFNVV